MAEQQVVTERTQVNVGGRIFEIPSSKVNQLLSMLESWKTIQVAEGATTNKPKKWNGRTLLNG